MKIKIPTNSLREMTRIQTLLLYRAFRGDFITEIDVLSYMIRHSVGGVYIISSSYREVIGKSIGRPKSAVMKSIERLSKRKLISFKPATLTKNRGKGCYVFHPSFEQLTKKPTTIQFSF